VNVYPTVYEVLSIHRTLIERFGGIHGVRDHPFLDGNKRVAITVTAAFLKVNGYRLEFSDEAAFSFLTRLYETGQMRFAELDTWLRLHIVPL
jgi:death-on-curing protein